MILYEKEQDLFRLDPNEWVFAHCISSDFKLGAGVAKEFAKRGVKKELMQNYSSCNCWNKVGYSITTVANGYTVGNLVTKGRYFEKPTLETLTQALLSFKDYVMEHSYKKIAMPQIGCGLDRLKYDDVLPIIENIFGDLDIEILVCIKD